MHKPAALMVLLMAMASACTVPTPTPRDSIAPPGAGMIDQPCPDLPSLGVRPLAEPGNVPKTEPHLAQTYQAITAYRARYDWPALCRYKAENAAIPNGEAVRVVFMGDSITDNWKRYDAAFFTRGVHDRGISGQTSPQMVARFYQDVVALKPAIVHIMAGTNDIAGNTGPNSPTDYKNAIAAMVDMAQANGIQVILASIPPTSRFTWAPDLKPAPRVKELNAWLKDYAAARGAVYADYYAAMATADGSPRDGLTFDGVHPGSAGYKVMGAIAAKAIAEAEARSQSQN
jgi:lysophospholipase L1-like esterase